MEMKTQITQITLDTMMGIREGVGQVRTTEFKSYIEDLIAAKEAGIDVTTIPWPMLSDRVKQGIEAGLSSETTGSVDGDVSWKIISLGGSYSNQTQQGIKVKVDMEFMSPGAPDLTVIKEMTPEDLRKLLLVVDDKPADSE